MNLDSLNQDQLVFKGAPVKRRTMTLSLDRPDLQQVQPKITASVQRTLSPKTPIKKVRVLHKPESNKARANQLTNRSSLDKIRIVGSKTTRLRK